jgi:hypothetical protein
MGNSSNAYSSARPLQGSVVDLISGIEQQDNFNKQFKYRKDKDEQDRQDQNGKELRAALEKTSTPITGYSSHDEASIDFIGRAGGLRDQITATTIALQKDPSNPELITKSINLEKSIDTIKQMQTGLMSKTSDLSEGLKSRKYSGYLNQGTAKAYNGMVAEYKYRFDTDEKGNVIVNSGSGNFDRDGDGVPDTFNLQDVYDTNKFGESKLRFDTETYLKEAKLRYGSKEQVRDGVSGYTKTTIKGFDDNKRQDLSDEIDGLFGKDKASMTDTAKSYFGDDREIEPKNMTDDEFTKYKKEFQNRLENSYETVDKKEKDSADQNADEALAYRKKKDALDRDDKKNEDAVKISDPSTISKGGMKDGVFLKQNTRSFPLGNVIIKGDGGKVQKATNVYVMPNGVTYIRMEDSGFETSSTSKKSLTKEGKAKADYNDRNVEYHKKFPEKKKEIYDTDYVTESTSDKTARVRMLRVGTNAGEAGRIAIRMGYESAKDMDDDFKNRSGFKKAGTKAESKSNEPEVDEFGVPTN